MNRIVYRVLQKSLNFQHFECNSTVRNFQTLPVVLISRSLVTRCTVLHQKTDGMNVVKTDGPPKAASVVAQKKSKLSPKITLIGQNNSLTVTALEEAQKLAKRRDLHLVLVQELDTKTQRPVYKLSTAAELLAEELESGNKTSTSDKDKNAQKKSEKSLTIGSRISEHDLESRLKNISKWLAKHHEVRILIQGSSDDMTSGEKIVKTIEKSIKEPNVIGKIVQKRLKGQVIKFNILPVPPVKQA